MQSQTFVETRNVQLVRTAIAGALKTNGFIAVICEVGSGKTTFYNRNLDHWSSNAHRFNACALKAFKSRTSRIGQIMRLMIESLDPDGSCPASAERQYDRLARLLRDAEKKGRRTVLVIDEAQDLHWQTFRDLKKLHEISGKSEHLFSIVLFGKPGGIWDRMFGGAELGFRIDPVRLGQLAEEEIIEIAEKAFGLRFSTEMVKKRFAAAVPGRTPLGIKHLGKLLRKEFPQQENEDSGNFRVTNDHIQALPHLSLRYRLRKSPYTQKDLVKKAKEMFPNTRGINAQRVSDRMNGRLEPESPVAVALDQAFEALLGGGGRREEIMPAENAG